MKKIAAILFALAVSTGAGAVTISVGYDTINGVDVPANKSYTSKQQSFDLTVKEKINDYFAADVSIKNTINNTDESHAINSSRAEFGLVGTMPVFGPVSAYTRVGLGQKFTTSNNFSYYSVEPGVIVKVPGVTGLTAKVGYRFRDATDNSNTDNSETTRVGLSYQLPSKDVVGVGYDRQTGSSSQNSIKFNYSHSF
jgi:hypothetical protein